MPESIIPLLSAEELIELCELIEHALENSLNKLSEKYIGLLRRADRSTGVKVAAGWVNAAVRNRAAGVKESSALCKLRDTVLLQLGTNADASSGHHGLRGDAASHAQPLMPALSEGRLIQLAFETILGRGCSPRELTDWQRKLERKESTREGLVATLFALSAQEAEADRANEAAHEPRVLHVMGTGERVTRADWRARAKRLNAERPAVGAPLERHARFQFDCRTADRRNRHYEPMPRRAAHPPVHGEHHPADMLPRLRGIDHRRRQFA